MSDQSQAEDTSPSTPTEEGREHSEFEQPSQETEDEVKEVEEEYDTVSRSALAERGACDLSRKAIRVFFTAI